MANGAYVGVQGIAPDLRPSIQAAQQAARERQAQKQAQKNWEREFELEQQKLEATKAASQQEGVKDWLERGHKLLDEITKTYNSAVDDLTTLPAGQEFLSNGIEYLAGLKESAELSKNPQDVFITRQKYEQGVKSLKVVTGAMKSISEFVPDLTDARFKKGTITVTDADGNNQEISYEDALKEYGSNEYKYVDDGKSKYISNGLISMGIDNDGKFYAKIGNKTFHDPQAIKSYMSSWYFKKDDSMVKNLDKIFDIKLPTKETTLEDGELSKISDWDTFNNSIDEAIRTSDLSNYKDEQTYFELLNDGDAAIVEAFNMYGVANNAKTVGDLKQAIRDRAKSMQTPVDVNKEGKTAKRIAPLPSNINYQDTANVENLIAQYSASNDPTIRNKGEAMSVGLGIANNLYEALVNRKAGALSMYGYDTVTYNADGTVTISGGKASVSTSKSDNGKTERSSYTENVKPIDIDLSNPQDIQNAVQAILIAYNKEVGSDGVRISFTDIVPMFDFKGITVTKPKDDELKAMNELREALSSFSGDTDDNIDMPDGNYGDSKDAILTYIQKYLGEGYSVKVKDEYASKANLEIIITDKDGNNVGTYRMNLDKDEYGNQGYLSHDGHDWYMPAIVLDDIQKLKYSYSGSILKGEPVEEQPQTAPQAEEQTQEQSNQEVAQEPKTETQEQATTQPKEEEKQKTGGLPPAPTGNTSTVSSNDDDLD